MCIIVGSNPYLIVNTELTPIFEIEKAGRENPGLYKVVGKNYELNERGMLIGKDIFTGPLGQSKELIEKISIGYFNQNLTIDIPEPRLMSADEIADETLLVFMQIGVDPLVTIRKFNDYALYKVKIEYANEPGEQITHIIATHDRLKIIDCLKDKVHETVLEHIRCWLNGEIELDDMKKRIEVASSKIDIEVGGKS